MAFDHDIRISPRSLLTFVILYFLCALLFTVLYGHFAPRPWPFWRWYELLIQSVLFFLGILLGMVYLQGQIVAQHESNLHVLNANIAIQAYSRLGEVMHRTRKAIHDNIALLADVMIPIQTGLWVVPGLPQITTDNMTQRQRVLRDSLDELSQSLEHHRVSSSSLLVRQLDLYERLSALNVELDSFHLQASQVLPLDPSSSRFIDHGQLMGGGQSLRREIVRAATEMADFRNSQQEYLREMLGGPVQLATYEDPYDSLARAKFSELLAIARALKQHDQSSFRSVEALVLESALELYDHQPFWSLQIIELTDALPPTGKLVDFLARASRVEVFAAVLDHFVAVADDHDYQEVTNEIVHRYHVGRVGDAVLRGWIRSSIKNRGIEARDVLSKEASFLSAEAQGNRTGVDLLVLARDSIVSAGTQGVFDILVFSDSRYENVEIDVELHGIEEGTLDLSDIVVFQTPPAAANGARISLRDQSPAFSVHFDSIERVLDPFRFSITVTVATPAEERIVSCKAAMRTGTLTAEDRAILVSTVETTLQLELNSGCIDQTGVFKQQTEFERSLWDSVCLELQVTNQTAFRASGIVVRTKLDPQADLISIQDVVFMSQGEVGEEIGEELVWRIGELAPNTGAVLRLAASARESGIARSHARVTSDQMRGEIAKELEIALLN